VRLEGLTLFRSGVGPAGARALGDALCLGANTTLLSLALDCNEAIGDEGVAGLARGLTTNRALKMLSLAACSIGPRGAAALGAALKSPLCVLEKIDLSGNAIGAEGLLALAEGAAASKTLQALVLSNCTIAGGCGSGAAAAAASNAATPAAAAATPSESKGGEGDAAPPPLGKRALLTLGAALRETVCGLNSVDLDANPLSAGDADVLVPFLEGNGKVVSFRVPVTLPPDRFSKLFRAPAPAKKKKGGKK
jgi:hypothetical protein